MKTVKCFFQLIWSLIVNYGNMRKIKAMDKNNIDRKEREEFVYKVTSKWARYVVNSTGSNVKVYGEDNVLKDTPVVYICNHLSDFDIPLLMGYVDAPKGFIAKIEMLKVPVVRTWMTFIHCVFMDRSNLRKSAASIIEGVKIIKNGNSLVIFPEGTRSKDGKMLEFKGGSFKLATKAKVPIIPITLVGSNNIFEANNKRIKSADVKIFIHPAIETKDLTKAEAEELPAKVKAIIASKLN